MIIHLIDGTYELYRHFYGLRRFNNGVDAPFGAVIGVLNTVLQMLEADATHVGVATDHVIESIRNDLWAGYKTGEGIDPALHAQFFPLEDALLAMGVATWPMVELEADDGLASAARLAELDGRATAISIWTPDKDLAQCVRGDRVVQVDRKSKKIRNEAGVREKFGVEPRLIPDYLALVGDAADGYPGIPGIGAVSAARLLNKHGPIESFPHDVLGDRRPLALLFKDLATLRTDAPLFANVDELLWPGPTEGFAALAEQMGDSRLMARCERVLPMVNEREHN
ncbi:MAG: 5'-3' exonuclease H3TH domain-containing protein [bacterium]